MLALPVNIFLLGGSLIFCFLVGYMIRSYRIRTLRNKVSELESEVLGNHAEILEMQKERVLLEQKLIDTLSEIPVVPMKGTKEKDDKNTDIPDISLRKKLLSKQADKH